MKICQWNVENLFILMDRYKNQDLEKITEEEWQSLSISTTTKNKSLRKIYEAVEVIEDIDADIFMFCEVGGKESLENFNKYFLEDKYYVFCDDGNSKRGICCGFLVNKRIRLNFKIRSNKEYKLKDNKRFSRDILSLDFKIKDERYRLLLTHLKSLISTDKDPQGVIQRSREVRGFCQMYEKMTAENIIFSGDLNSDIYHADEFKPLLKTDLKDLHEIEKSSEKDRTTHVYFGRQERMLHQFDYIMMNKNMRDKYTDGYTYRFKTMYGDIMDLPDTLQEKKELPSDHYPVIVIIDTNS